jgi:D-amino peptidase
MSRSSRRKHARTRPLIVALLVLAAPELAAQQRPKIYISADMEGLAGVVTSEQLGPTGFEYERFREFMTAEVDAAIAGARAAGAGEILVSDSHGNGQNLLIEKLPPDVTVVRSWPRPLGMMEGIDDSFAGVIFIGYHASTANPAGVRAHTFSSGTLADLKLNGVSVPEAVFNAAIAGHFGVPVIMISGDDVIMAEARALLGDIEGAVTKWALSFESARTLTPAAACDIIRATAERAVRRIRDFQPYRLREPVTLDVRFKNYRPAELLAYLPGVERTDSHSIRFVGKDMVEVSRFIEFILDYEPSLTP